MSNLSIGISFVVQGPVVSNPGLGAYSTKQVLESIRRYYPQSEIILSTWEGSDVEDLIYDQLVLSADPGGFLHNGVLINNNRMIQSTRAGIAKATRKYLVKTRTDILFTGNLLINRLEHLAPVTGKYALFTRQVLSTIYYVRNPLVLNLVFHGSDIFLAGLKEDVSALFDAETQPRSFFINTDESTRVVAEQYLLTDLIRRKLGRTYHVNRWGHVSLRLFAASEKYLFKNYAFLDTKELGIEFPERLYSAYMYHANYRLQDAKQLNEVYNKKSLFNLLVWKRLVTYTAKYYLPESVGQFLISCIMRLKNLLHVRKTEPAVTKI